MSYTVRILRRAQKNLARVPKDDYLRIRDAIRSLADDPRPSGVRKLSGRSGWRLRVGRYRVLYEIEDRQLVILVLDVGQRREIYR